MSHGFAVDIGLMLRMGVHSKAVNHARKLGALQGRQGRRPLDIGIAISRHIGHVQRICGTAMMPIIRLVVGHRRREGTAIVIHLPLRLLIVGVRIEFLAMWLRLESAGC